MIDFLETDTNTVKDSIISAYEALAGRSLAKADPIRLFLESIAYIIVQQRQLINYAGNMNLLNYATGNYLDEIGVLVGCTRTPAAAATATMTATLSAARPSAITIPAGTRISTVDNVIFATDEVLTIPAGEITGTVGATCEATGAAGNSYAAGEINKIIDPVAYVATIVNSTTSEGGADIEDDETYRARIQEAPEKFSVAGPDGAYEYWAKTASSTIADVSVTSPKPGEVEIYPLLENGVIPGQEMLDKIAETLGDDVRPLTDKVAVVAPTAVRYDINLKYYIGTDDKVSSVAIQAAVQAAVDNYVIWQKSKMGRDINPSRLIQMVVTAGAKRVDVTSPVFATVGDHEVAVADNVTVEYGGLENE